MDTKFFYFVSFPALNLQESKKGQVMQSADWKLNSEELESLFNEKTKAIIFNNPNNPLGKVFTRLVD